MNIQEIQLPFKTDVQLFIKRLDLIHPILSGNKYYKLKYNIKQAKELQSDTLLTFGGAFSNHLIAVACAGNEYNFRTIGIVRGEELIQSWQANHTLQKCVEFGMKLYFIDRTSYRLKGKSNFCKNIIIENSKLYIIPEGGTNELAVKGTQEILNQDTQSFQYICSPVGTGGTLAGLSLAALKNQNIIGFSSLKDGRFLVNEILKYSKKENFVVNLDYHLGGYAKINEELVHFMNDFKLINNIILDPIYTSKMLYGIFDLIKKNYFPNQAKILAIHTGGIQGIQGVNEVLKRKKMQLINN